MRSACFSPTFSTFWNCSTPPDNNLIGYFAHVTIDSVKIVVSPSDGHQSTYLPHCIQRKVIFVWLAWYMCAPNTPVYVIFVGLQNLHFLVISYNVRDQVAFMKVQQILQIGHQDKIPWKHFPHSRSRLAQPPLKSIRCLANRELTPGDRFN